MRPPPRRRSGWKRLLGVAAALVACEPMAPGTDPCRNIPSCQDVEYRIDVHRNGLLEPDSSGAVRMERPGFRILILEEPIPASVACLGWGRGAAYAHSCKACSGPSLQIDSFYFTTDILVNPGDTVPSGFNLAAVPRPPRFWGRTLVVDSLQPIRFRDSLFEIRFSGTVDGIRKFGGQAIRIAHPGLLFP